MHETTGNLWDYVRAGSVIAITTNGQVRNGKNVMGRGCAKEAKDRFPGIDARIGNLINTWNNRSFRLNMHHAYWGSWVLVTFPTKHHWREMSDPKLIIDSAEQIVEMADKWKWPTLYMPRPGCGNGGLLWEDVKDMLDQIFDDRFIAVSPYVPISPAKR